MQIFQKKQGSNSQGEGQQTHLFPIGNAILWGSGWGQPLGELNAKAPCSLTVLSGCCSGREKETEGTGISPELFLRSSLHTHFRVP